MIDDWIDEVFIFNRVKSSKRKDVVFPISFHYHLMNVGVDERVAFDGLIHINCRYSQQGVEDANRAWLHRYHQGFSKLFLLDLLIKIWRVDDPPNDWWRTMHVLVYINLRLRWNDALRQTWFPIFVLNWKINATIITQNFNNALVVIHRSNQKCRALISDITRIDINAIQTKKKLQQRKIIRFSSDHQRSLIIKQKVPIQLKLNNNAIITTIIIIIVIVIAIIVIIIVVIIIVNVVIIIIVVIIVIAIAIIIIIIIVVVVVVVVIFAFAFVFVFVVFVSLVVLTFIKYGEKKVTDV